MITQDEIRDLKAAEHKIADVQIAILKRDGEQDGEWRVLFRVRCDLAREIERLKAKS